MLKQTVVFLTLVCVAFAALAIGPLEDKPEKFKNVEGCYIKELDAVIRFGEAAPSKCSCMKYECQDTMMEYVSCGSVAAQAPCYIVEDQSKLYPDCCPKVQCPEND